MVIEYDLNDENFIILAAKHYDTPNCIRSEFESDLKRIKYVKRLIRKYSISGDIKERLVLNHIIILANVFGIEFTTKMLFYKIDKNCYPILKTFLVYLNYMPSEIKTINKGVTIYSSDISLDQKIVDKLRKV